MGNTGNAVTVPIVVYLIEKTALLPCYRSRPYHFRCEGMMAGGGRFGARQGGGLPREAI